MLHRKHAALAAALALIAGCTGDARNPAAPNAEPRLVIGDAAHAGAVPGFYFLPPVTRKPVFSGSFDAGLAPTVEICELAGAACGPLVADFDFGTGAAHVRLAGNHYLANWTRTKGLDPAKFYRIRVRVGAFELGFADVDVVETGAQRSAVDGDQYVPLRRGQALPIKFRIERGIVGQVVVSPTADTVNVGGTTQFSAALVDLHGDPVSGPLPAWTSSAPAVATVDGAGVATGAAAGAAIITASLGYVSGSATLTVEQPNLPPVAAADSFQAIGNVTVPVAAPGVLANDTDPDANPLTAIAGTLPTAAGGTVTLAADGSFTYRGAAGFTGTDSFAYTVTDGIAASAPITVTMTVPRRVWYVDNAAAAPGDGRDGSPFAALADAEAASGAGETILVRYGDGTSGGYDQGITLKPGQSLTGQGIGAALTTTLNGASLTLLPAGSAPTLTRTGPGATVALATDNVIQGITVTSAGGAGISGTGFGTLSVVATRVAAQGGPALSLQNGVLAASFDALGSAGSAADGLHLAGVGGTLAAPAGSISGAAGSGVAVAGGDAAVSFGGDIAGSAVRAVEVTGRTGGALTLSGSVTDASGGIRVHGNGGGTIAFTGPAKVLSTGAGAAVTLTGNGGTTIAFAGGGLAISTTTGHGFTASGGGTVSVTGADNTVTTAGGVAVSVTGTAIGAAGMTFRRVSASGGPNGIVLVNTGAANGMQVTGDGVTAGSGGTLTGMAGADGATAGTGVYLSSVRTVALRFMHLHDFDNYAVRGVDVAGFTLHGTLVDGVNGTSAALGEGSVVFDQLTGVAAVTASTIRGGAQDNVRVVNSAGVLDRITLDGAVIGANGTTGGDRGVELAAHGTGVMNASILNSTFTSARGTLLHYRLRDDAAGDLVITGSAFSNDHPATVGGGGGVAVDASGTARLTYLISGNTLRDALGSALAISQSAGTAVLSGTVSGNTVGLAGVANSGSAQGSGISLTTAGGGVHTVAVIGNQVRQYNNQGILLQMGDASSGGAGTLNATVTGNTVGSPGTAPFSKNGVHLNLGTASGDAHQACLALSGNTLTGSGSGGAAGTDIRLRQRFLTTVRLPGYGGAANDNAAVQAFLKAANGGSPTALAQNAVATGGGGYVGGAGCLTP